MAIGYFYQGEHFGEAGLKIDYTQNKRICKMCWACQKCGQMRGELRKQDFSVVPKAFGTKRENRSFPRGGLSIFLACLFW